MNASVVNVKVMIKWLNLYIPISLNSRLLPPMKTKGKGVFGGERMERIS
jgi:hypothetical protein